MAKSEAKGLVELVNCRMWDASLRLKHLRSIFTPIPYLQHRGSKSKREYRLSINDLGCRAESLEHRAKI